MHLLSRGILLAFLVLLPLIGTLLYAQSAWKLAAYSLILDGGTTLLWIGGATGLGLFVGGRLRLWDDTTGISLRLATSAATGLGILSLTLLGLGLAGWLNGATAWALIGSGWLAGIVAARTWRRESGPGAFERWIAEPAGWEWLALLATPFLALALTSALAPPGALWTPEEPHGYDVVEYHLQVPREWYEAHRIIPLHHNVYSYFPFNVELHYLLAMHLRGGPWAGMYAAQFMHVTFMVLMGLAVYGLAQPKAGPAGAIIAAMSLLTVPWLTQLAGIAYDEGGFLLFGILAIGWAMTATSESRHAFRRFAFAGAMAGLAAGSKLTGVPEVLVAVPIVCACGAIWNKLAGSSHLPDAGSEVLRRAGSIGEESGSSEYLRTGVGILKSDPNKPTFWIGIALFCLTGILTFSPWMIRNARWAGNPVFPELLPILGSNDFTPVQVQRWELAHHPPPEQRPITARVATFWREIVVGWQFGYLLLPMGTVAFALSIRRPIAWQLFGLLALLTVFWLFFTHLQGRFLILAAPVAALLVARIDWRGMPYIGAAIVVVFAAVGWWPINSRLCSKLYGSNGKGAMVQLLALDDLSYISLKLPPFSDVPPDARLCLVGDARAFWYPLPMSQIRYRSVFDVKDGESDVVKAWIGPEGRRPGEIILVDPAELKRFKATYFGLPPLPDEVKGKDQRYIEP